MPRVNSTLPAPMIAIFATCRSVAGVGLAEREREGLGASIEELDREHTIDHGPGLANQLIHPLPVEDAGPAPVDIGAGRVSRWLCVDRDAERHRRAASRRPHDEMHVA